jgi:hypothetical protein
MSCYLRAWGRTFDVDAFVRDSSIEWKDIWRVGEQRLAGLRKGTPHEESGLQLHVAAGDDLPNLVTAATAFLRNHARELPRLKESHGVECIVIDFGLTFDRSNAAQFSYLPPELLRQAADVNCGIEVSYYDFG